MAWEQTDPLFVKGGRLWVDTFFVSERRPTPIEIEITKTPRGGDRWSVPKLGTDLWRNRTLGEWLGDNPVSQLVDFIGDRNGVGTFVQLYGMAGAAVQAEHAETMGLGATGSKIKDLTINLGVYSFAPQVIGKRIKG